MDEHYYMKRLQVTGPWNNVKCKKDKTDILVSAKLSSGVKKDL
jgi:hypothetical protein